jgi:TonB family protein
LKEKRRVLLKINPDDVPAFAACGRAAPPLSRRSLAASLSAHALAAALVLSMHFAPEPTTAAHPHAILLYTPLTPPEPEQAPRPTTVRRPALEAAPKPKRPVFLPHPVPAPRPRILGEAPPEPPKTAPPAPVLPVAALAPPRPEKRSAPPLELGTFSSPVVAKTALARLPAPVGAFGDASALPGSQTRDAVTTGGLGPATASHGSSRAGGSGVAGAGFGDAVASSASSASGSVRPAGFESAAASTPKATEPAAGAPDASPVEILAKPRPAYTDEARRLKIEGDVLLEALFTASGQVRVLKVLRGLGHGLDESAIRAAEGIRFRPAMHGGAPVDVTAVARITFQLAH